MAKKKAKKKVEAEAKAEHPKKASKKKQSSAGWIVGVIIVIVIIVAIVLLLRGTNQAETPQAPTTPEEKPAPAAPEKPQAVSEAPEEVKDCSVAYAIGWPKNKLGNLCGIEGSTFNVQLTYSGNADSLSGLWFKVTTADGSVEYFKDAREMAKGQIMQYSFDAGAGVKDVLALPIINEGGVDKACLNQRLLVVKSTECVAS